MKKLFFATLILIPLFISCKKDDPDPGNSNETELTPAMARDSLYFLMNSWYYWYNQMPAVTKENYDDPYKLMDAMMYKALDQWSFVADYDEFNAEMKGTFVGHGIRIGLDNSQNARIAMIYKKSPLYAEGVRRGWIIKKINDVDLAPIMISGDATAYNNLLGSSSAAVTNKFLFQKPDGTEAEISSTKASFTVNSVLLYDTLHLKSDKIAGHLVFESFIEPSPAELAEAFTFFKANNVTDLILDLRYNSGGYLYVAQGLASYIAGNSLATSRSVFATLQYNDKHTDQNTSYLFQSTSYPLSLPRMAVITSRLTASASEAVMNGLKPFMEIVSVGDTTYGKPVGMNGWALGEKYFFWPITFKIINKNSEGDYFDGLAPNKVVADDITHDFDDRNEFCLKEAIYYLENGSVSAKGTSDFYRHPQFSEKPSWMNNGFAIEKTTK